MSGDWSRVVLFDVDGVLIDSGDAHNRVWSSWARIRGLDPVAVRAATQGRRRIDTLRQVAPHLDFEEEHRLLDELMALEEPGLRAYDDAEPVLRGLPSGSWAVVTSSRARRTADRLVATGLPLPEVRICAEDVTEGKPSPEGYLTAAARLGATPARCIVIEDSPAGITAGLRARCTVYALATTHRPEQLAHAHACFPTLAAAARQLRYALE